MDLRVDDLPGKGRFQQTVSESAIAVQFEGNNNSVAILYSGSARLILDRRHRRRRATAVLSDLLHPDNNGALVGRADEVGLLQSWLESDQLISVHCILGRAGTGKTRLAIELCAIAEGLKWLAGFAPRDAGLGDFVRNFDISMWKWESPLFVVVDDAAASYKSLRIWLEKLSIVEKPKSLPKLRILLLERDAQRNSNVGWWREMFRPSGRDQPQIDGFVDPKAPLKLTSIAKVEDRRALLHAVLQEAASLTKPKKKLALQAPGQNALLDAWLASDGLEVEPLYLIMNAIVSLERGLFEFNLSRTRAAEILAGHEEVRLRAIANTFGLSEDQCNFFLHVVACITLEGGCDLDRAAVIVEKEQEKITCSGGVPFTVMRCLAQALPRPGFKGVDPVQPDLIGEYFAVDLINRVIVGENAKREIIERAWRREPIKVATTLIRATEDYTVSGDDDDFVSGEIGVASIGWLRHLIGVETAIINLRSIEAEVPQRSGVLFEIGIALNKRIIALAESGRSNEREMQSIVAGAYGRVATRLSHFRKFDEALEPARRAIEIYKSLGGNRIDEDDHYLGRALNDYANALKSLGRREEALQFAYESVACFRSIASKQVNPMQLSAVLGTLGAMLMDLDRNSEALEIEDEAIRLMQSPEKFLTYVDINNLSAIYMNRAHTLFSLDRWEESLTAADRATELQIPNGTGIFGNELERILFRYLGLFGRLVERGLFAEAADRALHLTRKFGEEFAEIWIFLGFVEKLWKELQEQQKYNQAAIVGEKLLDFYEHIGKIDLYNVRVDPTTTVAEHAGNLASVYYLITREGGEEDFFIRGIALSERSIALFRGIEDDETRKSDELCGELHNLTLHLQGYALYLGNLGRVVEGLEAANRQVVVGCELAGMRPGEPPYDLFYALDDQYRFVSQLNESNSLEKTLNVVAGVVSTLSRLAQNYPETFSLILVKVLMLFAEYLDRSGRLEEGLRSNEQALKVLEWPLQNFGPENIKECVVTTCNLYMRRCNQLGIEPHSVPPVLIIS